jgi:hypothetical protein
LGIYAGGEWSRVVMEGRGAEEGETPMLQGRRGLNYAGGEWSRAVNAEEGRDWRARGEGRLRGVGYGLPISQASQCGYTRTRK